MSSFEAVRTGLVVLEGLLNLCLCVHNDWAILGDWLFNWLSCYKDETGGVSHKLVIDDLPIQNTNMLIVDLSRPIVDEAAFKDKNIGVPFGGDVQVEIAILV